jgi:hypothetical protein
MLKKVFLLFILIFFLFFSRKCLAQEMSAEEQYQSFLKKYRVYQAGSDYYKNAKSKYLSYQSVTSRVDYLGLSKKYLISEIEAGESYAVFIRSRLTEATKILNYQENFYFIKLDDEITYLSLLKKRINEASSISDLMALWTDFETHFATISSYGYSIKSYIEIGSLEKIDENLKITKDKLSQYLTENPAETPYLKASRDNFSVLEKDYAKIEASVNSIKNLKKNLSSPKVTKEMADQVRGEVNQTLTQIQTLIASYQRLLQTIVLK